MGAILSTNFGKNFHYGNSNLIFFSFPFSFMTPAVISPRAELATHHVAESKSSWDVIEVSPAIDFDDLWSIVKRRTKWFIAIPLACAIVAYVFAKLAMTPYYKSNALIFIDPMFDQVLQVETVGPMMSDLDSLNSLEKAIVSDSMILRVVDKLNLRSDLDFLPKSLHKYLRKGEPLSSSRLLQEIRKKRVSASLIRPTRLLELTVFDSDPNRAQLIAQTFVDEFEVFLGEQKRREAGNSSQDLRRQAGEAYTRALEAEKLIETFRMQNPGLTVEQDHQLFAERLTKIGEELNLISGKVLDLQSKVETLKDVNPETDPIKVITVGNFSGIEHVSELLNQRLAAHANLASTAEQYTETHPRYREAKSRVTEIDAQLKQLASDFKATIDADQAKALANEKMLTQRVTELQGQLTAQKSASSEFRAIQQKVETEWQIHESLQRKIGETSLGSEKSTEIATLMSAPIVAHKPSKPAKPIIALGGGFVGALFCFGMVAFELLRGVPFVNRRQLEHSLNVPVVAEVSLPAGGGNDAALVEEMSRALLSPRCRQARFIHVSSVWEQAEGIRVAGCLASASAFYGCPTLLISIMPGGNPNTLVNLTPQMTHIDNLQTLRLPSSFLIAPTNPWQLLGPHRQHFGRIVIESTTCAQASRIPALIATFADANLLLVNEGRGTKMDIESAVAQLGGQDGTSLSLILQS